MVEIKRGDIILCDSVLLCEQIRVIDKSRIIRVIGHLDNDYMTQVQAALCNILGLFSANDTEN